MPTPESEICKNLLSDWERRGRNHSEYAALFIFSRHFMFQAIGAMCAGSKQYVVRVELERLSQPRQNLFVCPLSVRKSIPANVPCVSFVCEKACPSEKNSLRARCLRTLVIVMEGKARLGSSFAWTRFGKRCASSAGMDR